MNTHIARKNRFCWPASVGLFMPLVDARIREDFTGRYVVGRIGGQPYDPFEAYFNSEERREGATPPHLAFSRLTGDDDQAKGFLETYGPLTMVSRLGQQTDKKMFEELDLWWRESVREAREQYENPKEYLRQHFLFDPIILPARPARKPELVTVSLNDFWAAQEHFLFLNLLIEAVCSERPSSEVRSLLTRFVSRPPEERVGVGVLTPEVYADFQIVLGVRSPLNMGRKPYVEALKKVLLYAIQKKDDEEILSAATRLLQLRISERLSKVCPALTSGPRISGPSCNSLQPFWLCRSLIEALYMMVFLDIEHGRRVIRCEGCGVLFQDAKENVLYCSSRCETRKRVRDWWRKHGKRYRIKHRKTTPRRSQ